ncbi:Glucanase [Madurella fahalii]|uniref:Glucanase n=1 Tax=Madurella fahalii TaxID=1157608 RepID=A0ABQ0GL32_9PEZI
MIYSILLGLSLAYGASAACSRATLEEATASYVRAQTAGQLDLLSLASEVSYAENDTPMDIAEGVLSQAITIDFNRSIHDTVECATFTELTAATAEHPYVIHTRMLVADANITAIESVVTDQGDWIFNATGHLYWTQQENWDPIPAEQRDTREVIKAAGDAYLNQWFNSTLPVPLGTPCARLEGGIYTGQRNASANTCAMPAFPTPIDAGNRRYVIDEELGAVGIFNGFPWLEASDPEAVMPSSNLFRVQGGLIRYIHEVTVCKTPMCGR